MSVKFLVTNITNNVKYHAEQCNGASLRICRVSCVSLPHELFEWCHMTGISLSTTTSEELLDGTLQCAGFTTSRRIIDRS